MAEGHPGKLKGPYSRVCPWDEAATVISNKSNERIEMVELEARRALGDENTDFTINLDDPVAPDEKLDGFKIPEQFSKMCFDAAYSHIMQVDWAMASVPRLRWSPQGNPLQGVWWRLSRPLQDVREISVRSKPVDKSCWEILWEYRRL